MPSPASKKTRTVAKRRRSTPRRVRKSAGPSFGEWARRVAGMVKGAPRDLSTREGFGDN